MADKGKETLEVIGSANDVLGLMVLFFDLGNELNKWVTKTSDAPDPIMAALRKVHTALDKIEDLSLSTWVSSREDNLSFLFAHSSAALQTANAFLKSGKSRSDPEWAAKIALAERDSLVAVETFTGELEGGFWLRPESIKAISWAGDPRGVDSGWMPHMPDRAEIHSFNRVWDHRWALPAAVYAITVRIAVLKACGANAAATRREINRYNNFIAGVFQKMESGIRSIDPLSEARITPTGVPIAVADIYGGYYVGGLFEPTLWRHSKYAHIPIPPGLLLPTRTVQENRNTLLSHYRNHVKITIGLAELLRFAGGLENLLVIPPKPKKIKKIGRFFRSARAWVAAWGPNRLDIFGLGDDRAMYHKAWNGSAWDPSSPDNWERLGGFFSSPSAVVPWGPNRLDIFGLGGDRAMYHKAWNGSAWDPSSPDNWERLGGVFSEP